MHYELAIVVPTKNEAGNVRQLVGLLEAALAGIRWQVIFVDDDSADGTAAVVHEMGETRDNVLCLRRIGREGLSSAVIEGMMATGADCIAVMDADLQHDENLLPRMFRTLQNPDVDVVVASRFLDASERQNFPAFRERLSNAGIFLSRLVTRSRLTDPLSGFFMLRRGLAEEIVPRLNGQGFKILLDIFASASRPLRYEEVPLVFRERNAGVSKLDALVSLEFILLLADKLLHRRIPIRFLTFLLVGLSGLVIHLVLLGFFHKIARQPFLTAQIAATFIAMTSNFFLNNHLTYRDRRLAGRKLFSGLLLFYVICGAGAWGNFALAQFLYARAISWWLAGLIGAAVSAVWNYGVNNSFTWTRPRES
jgi:dolichol-phosphate mannosyltransferase